jgi:hypothetical protein
MTVAELHDHLRRPTRRRFLAGAGATAGLLVAGPTLVRRAARAAGAPPAGAHLSFGADPRTEMSIVWSTPGPVDHPRLSFGLADGSGTIVAAESRALPANLLVDTVSGPVATHYHRVRLTGLQPGTTYGYRLLHDGASSEVRSFATAPDTVRPFTFTAFGDQGVSDAAAALIAQIAAIRPAFNLVAGDLCYANGVGTAQALDALDFDPREWDRWFETTLASAASTPWMPTVGNHDVEPGYGPLGYDGHTARLALPTGGFNDHVYAFRYGNVAMVAVDANDVSTEIPHPYSLGGQTAWLDQQLAALRADPRVDFLVVYFHHCAFCTITAHGSDAGVRQQWVPLFDRHGVDLVINGHNHGYERTTPIRGGAPTVEAPAAAVVHPQQHGTTYICAGGGGRSPNHLGPPGQGFLSLGPSFEELPLLRQPEAAPWSAVALADNSFLRIDVDPAASASETTMRIATIDTTGTVVDSVVLSRPRLRAAAPSSPASTATAPAASGEPLPEIPVTGGRDGVLLPAAAAAAAGLAGLALASADPARPPRG